MRNVERRIRTLLAQQSGQIQVLIIAPILTLFLLSLVVRTASSAIDPALEKKKITQRLKQRLSEVRSADGVTSVLEAHGTGESSGPDGGKQSELETANKSHDAWSGGTFPEQTWQIAEEHVWQNAFLASVARDRATSNRQASLPQRMNAIETQWQLAELVPQGKLPLTPAITTARVSSHQRKSKGHEAAGVKVHNSEEVKKSIVSQEEKKPVPAPIVTAALGKVVIPTPAPARKEESISPLPESVSYKIKRKDTFEKILKQIGLSSAETAHWVRVTQKLREFRSLRTGKVLELTFTKEVENRALQTVTYIIEENLRLILERVKKGIIEAKRLQPPIQPVVVVLGGRIDKNLSSAIQKAGVPKRFVADLVDLAWDIDLKELRKGDSFKILFEAMRRGERIVEYKKLLAAELLNYGEVFTAFALPEEKRRLYKKRLAEEYKGKGLNIESEGQKFLPFPLEFSRISSVFTESRFHPILRRSRPHNGIDLAAPYGTPVLTVASGLVTFVGRQSGYGNIVKIDHPGPYETGYAHLQEFADGLTEGIKVKQGQIIGYVGSTGLATGPHLHFELLRDGVFVNPLMEKTSDQEPVKMASEEEEQKIDPIVEEKKQKLIAQLATLNVEKGIIKHHIIPQQNSTITTATLEVERINLDSQRAAVGTKVRR